MTLTKICLLLVLLTAPVCLLAQGPIGVFPWWEGQIAAELNLTDAQHQQVDAIQREYRTKMIDGRASMEKAELTLEDAMNAEPFDLRKATDAANKVADARNDLTRNLTQMSLRLRGVLTKEQWEKARARSPRPGGPRFEGRGGGRPSGGGPGGGGPGGPGRSTRGGGAPPPRGPGPGPGPGQPENE